MFDDSSFEDPYRDLRRLKEFVFTILKRKLNIHYYFNIRADFYKKVDDEFMKLLIKSGLRAIGLGLEAGNQKDILLYNKSADLEDNYRIIDFLKQYQIQYFVGFINFNAYTTLKTLEENLRFLKYVKMPFLYLTELEIYRGTKIFNKVHKDKLIKDKKICGKYIYKYINKDVENLVQFLFEYTKCVNKSHNNILNTLEEYYKRIPLQIFCIESNLEENNINNTRKKIVDRCIKRYSRISDRCCELLFLWYEHLLEELRKNGFHSEQCMQVTKQYLDIDEFLDIENEFTKISQLLSNWLI